MVLGQDVSIFEHGYADWVDMYHSTFTNFVYASCPFHKHFRRSAINSNTLLPGNIFILTWYQHITVTLHFFRFFPLRNAKIRASGSDFVQPTTGLTVDLPLSKPTSTSPIPEPVWKLYISVSSLFQPQFEPSVPWKIPLQVQVSTTSSVPDDDALISFDDSPDGPITDDFFLTSSPQATSSAVDRNPSSRQSFADSLNSLYIGKGHTR